MNYSYWCTSAIRHTYTLTGMPQYSWLNLTYCSGWMPFVIFFFQEEEKISRNYKYKIQIRGLKIVREYLRPPPPSRPPLFPFCFSIHSLYVSQTLCRNVKQCWWERKIKRFTPVRSHNLTQLLIHSVRKWPCAWLLFHFIPRDTCLAVFLKGLAELNQCVVNSKMCKCV